MNKAFIREADAHDPCCPRCAALGVEVLPAALATYLSPQHRHRLAASVYFCPTPSCPVAYFDALEGSVTADDLLLPAYPKDPDAPICACFAFSHADIELDVAEGVPRRVRELLTKAKSPQARCEERSPTGRCCIAEVQRQYMKLRSG
jgi:hypothetical protein